MPKGIKKVTANSIRAEIEKLQAALQEKENKIIRYKQECRAKIQKWKQEIAAGNSQIKKLEREYKNAVMEEQRQTIASIVFQEHLSDQEITDMIGAVQTLFSDAEHRQDAVDVLRRIADAHESTTIETLVESLTKTEK